MPSWRWGNLKNTHYPNNFRSNMVGVIRPPQDRHGQFLAGKTPTAQWQSHQQHVAPAVTNFYSEKFRQGLRLGGLANLDGPALDCNLINNPRMS